jgi:hypothetical protein
MVSSAHLPNLQPKVAKKAAAPKKAAAKKPAAKKAVRTGRDSSGRVCAPGTGTGGSAEPAGALPQSFRNQQQFQLPLQRRI